MTTNYGYFFHPPLDAHLLGHPQLDFNLYQKPTGLHFDPRRATLYVVNKDTRIESLTLSHPWPRRTDYQVCAGRVNFQDHKGKSVEAYTFGGRLALHDEDTFTRCSLTSPAPIIDLPTPSATSTLLVNEFECLLAHRRAVLGHKNGKFERRLIAADPLVLFIACLSILEGKLCHLSTETHSRYYQSVLSLAQKTIRVLQKQGIWAMQLYALDDIL